MEFVSNITDMLKVAGEVRIWKNGKAIEMDLPEQVDDEGIPFNIHRIVFGTTKSGKRYIETLSYKGDNWLVYGEASIPEILVFAKKAKEVLPDSEYTKELYELSLKIEAALAQV